MNYRSMLILSIALTLCVACEQAGVATGWSNAEARTAELNVTLMPSPTTPKTLLTPTAISPTVTSTATPPPDWRAKLPRDAKGRVIGGETFPIVNYSPTMIAAPHGKPCPRVSHWEFEIITMTAPLKSFGISKDPCVVQNAVDDLVGTIQFYPAFQSPQTMPAIDKVYDSDTANLCCVEKTLRTSMIRYFRAGEGVYHVCDKPVFHLLNVDARTPLIANNDGRVSGQAIQITLLRMSPGLQPFECRFMRYKNGQPSGGKFVITADMVAGKAETPAAVYNLLWNSRTQRWLVYFVDVVPMAEYAQVARELWAAIGR